MTKLNDLMMSRRTILKFSLGALAGGTASIAAAQKIAQASVQYQNMPKNGQECDGCVQFMAPNACKVVEGKVSPKGYCVAFAPKPK